MNAFKSLRSGRVAALRWSLLASLGVVPIACSGTTLQSGGDDDGGAGSGGSSAGKGTTTAGKTSMAGTTSTGTGGSIGLGGTSSGGSIAGGGRGSDRNCSVVSTDPTTGLVKCLQGYEARPRAVQCAVPAGAAPPFGGAGGGTTVVQPLPRADGNTGCDEDADCAAFALGYCPPPSDCFDGGGGVSSVCHSGCTEDADCGAGKVCLCDGSDHGGTCVTANCRVDADCGQALVCATLRPFGDIAGFACTSEPDECWTNTDCSDDQVCDLDRTEKRRQCFGVGVCGRPFLVEAAPRLPPVTARGDWMELGLAPRVEQLTTEERAGQAAHWTKLGQMEHASIAAFARFQLQLLALGAPAELVQACNQALVDETAHTRLCFALASAYAGRQLGPGPLDVSHSLDVTSLADIVELVIAEGCFGETSAALDALEAAEDATDPVIRAAYARIAEDEQRHAELAFRFVRWAVQRGDASVHERVQAVLSIPSAASYDARAVAEPCLRALLGARAA